ncbi:ImuA family protein [Sphingobacterium bambusae]|uniref:ImuA family protein n=1 Tax=Sphingobacterium bambusae TaxID=662858 RepID=A0ABW6BHQ4_9SPHI|nr:Error-prone repair protein ImuA [Sphingobacterium bambusae]WPL49033.1 Error-prone repair protein ImuA [Sphingobacterium bambusae]
MQEAINKQKTITDLQRQILAWQGFKEPNGQSASLGLGELEQAFPGNVFPVGVIHEFVTSCAEEEAASTGFIAGLLSELMRKGGAALWIGNTQELFAPAIRTFGIEPDRMVFICMKRDKDILWALEEALKCASLCVVIAEVKDLDFVQSRRLQLVVERSKVTGLVLRTATRIQMTTACAVRWQVRTMPSVVVDGLPGVGFPAWEVSLLKVRNGNPSQWQVAWQNNSFSMKQRQELPVKRSKTENRQVG